MLNSQFSVGGRTPLQDFSNILLLSYYPTYSNAENNNLMDFLSIRKERKETKVVKIRYQKFKENDVKDNFRQLQNCHEY